MMDAEALILLKKIKDRLTWAVVFLIVIMLNTCSLDDRISDAIRGNPDEEAAPAGSPTPAAVPTPAPTATQE